MTLLAGEDVRNISCYRFRNGEVRGARRGAARPWRGPDREALDHGMLRPWHG